MGNRPTTPNIECMVVFEGRAGRRPGKRNSPKRRNKSTDARASQPRRDELWPNMAARRYINMSRRTAVSLSRRAISWSTASKQGSAQSGKRNTGKGEWCAAAWAANDPRQHADEQQPPDAGVGSRYTISSVPTP